MEVFIVRVFTDSYAVGIDERRLARGEFQGLSFGMVFARGHPIELS